MSSLLYHIFGLLPITYFLVVLCVVCCGIVAKLFGQALIEASPEPVGRVLAKPIGVAFTGDRILDSLFETQLLDNIAHRLLSGLTAMLLGPSTPALALCTAGPQFNSRDGILAGKYWSGCPPKRMPG